MNKGKNIILKSEINENIKLIKNTENYYISENGNIYKKYDDNTYLKKSLKPNHTGYIYAGIKLNGKMITKRVHKLVALYFVENPNPEKFTVVGHKDNNKSNNTKENLYWTTISENTKKAFDDGLLVNDKGFGDSQSIPVTVYKNNKFFKEYGSVHECHRELTKILPKLDFSMILRRSHSNEKGKITKYRKFKEWDFWFSKDIKNH